MPAAFIPSAIDSAAVRCAGGELLALALLDARNHSLHLLSQYQRAMGSQELRVPSLPELNPPLWELGHIAWFQEWWIARNSQLRLGSACDPSAPRRPSILPPADRWWDSSNVVHDSRWQLDLPDLADVKSYLLATLEGTLELLAQTPDEDHALYFFRLALFHEDMHGEALIYMAQTLGLDLGRDLPARTSTPLRSPLTVPAQPWQLGSPSGTGFIFDNEKSPHEVPVLEFEIDAQAVSWAQYVEFVQDGGYDRPELWQPLGWQALQGRSAPRHVERIGKGALVGQRFGQTQRLDAGQAAMHLSWWEADAWCRWAGRRLPTEAEWEVAAHVLATRGFCWGQVWEWTASSFSPYPGFAADPYRDYSQPWFGTHKVLRGASWATRERMKSAKYRNFYLPERNDIFSGFRSCAI